MSHQEGRVAVITGGASGIGLAIGRRLARDGAWVALLDRDGAAAERAADELARSGYVAHGRACDVTDAEACRSAIASIAAEWGGVDVLVANAGISHRSLFEATDLEVVRRVIDVNLFGAVNVTAAALPSLIERRGGIAAISSVAGFAPLVGRTAYAASKHALHGFFGSLRAELRPRGVAVTLVCPSFVDSGIDAHALSGSGGRIASGKQVVGRLLTPETVAEAVADGVDRRRELVLVGAVSRSARWVSALFPRLYERMMVKRQGAEFGLAAS
jgi:NAD(P)-dependent dehydrogenase (short-subunit alcohol dehydrogenase family)